MTHKIRIERQFYGPTVRVSWYSEMYGHATPKDDADTMTRSECERKIEEMGNRDYHLDHNESGRPEYKIVRA